MANTLTVLKVYPTEREKRIRYGVTLSGNYAQVARGNDTGEVLKLEGASNPNFLPGASFGQKGADQVLLVNGPTAYSAEILPGANSNHWLLKIINLGLSTELAAGAYPAALTGDLDFQIEATGPNF